MVILQDGNWTTVHVAGDPPTVQLIVAIPVGRFKNITYLNKGHHGIVYSADDAFLARKVAIKQLLNPFFNEQVAKQVLRELEIMKMMGHPNVMSLLDVYTTGSTADTMSGLYLVMDLMEGTLGDINDDRLGPVLTHKFISSMIRQLLLALMYMKEANIVHRDLNPQNLLVSKDNETLRICDFGLARNISDNRTGAKFPILQYRAPELLIGYYNNCNVQSEMWSVGCILGELIKKNPLFSNYYDAQSQLTMILQELPIQNQELEFSFCNDDIKIRKRLNTLVADGNMDLAANRWEDLFPDGIFPETDPDHPVYLNGHECRKLLSRLLHFNPKERITPADALLLPYLNYGNQNAEPLVHATQDYIERETGRNQLGEMKEKIFNFIQSFQTVML